MNFSANNTQLEDIVVETIPEDDDTVTSVKDNVTTASVSSGDQFSTSGDHGCGQFSTGGDQFDDWLLCMSRKCQFEDSGKFENLKSDDTSTWKSNANNPDFSHALTTDTTHPPNTHV